MGPFLPLFSVTVEHRFFEHGVCRGLSFEPTPGSAARLRRAGCLLRAAQCGVTVWHDALSIDTLRSLADAAADPFEVVLLAHAADPWFASYTEGMTRDDGSLLCFDSAAAAAPDGAGRCRLHGGEFADESCRMSLHSPLLARLLPRPPGLPPPVFVLRLVVGGGGIDRDEWLRRNGARQYLVRLQTRATHWKYYLPPDWAEQQPHVVDLGGQARFEPASAALLGDGRPALTIRSRSAIALQDRPPQRFQLRARAAASDRILIKRLPVASAGQFDLETIDGVRTLVSEIYLNR